jgi:hypothetical protein
MATERVIDLEHQRYADREYEGELAPSAVAAAEAAKAEQQHRALVRLRAVASSSGAHPVTTVQLADLLTVLGLDE